MNPTRKLQVESADNERVRFNDIERDVEIVLHELSGDSSLEVFRAEYEKLHFALKRSHENEEALVAKCEQDTRTITDRAADVQKAIRVSQENTQTIASLRLAIDDGINGLAVLTQNEARSKDLVDGLRSNIAEVQAALNESIKQNNEAELSLITLKDEVGDFGRQSEMLVSQIKQAKQQIEAFTARQSTLKEQKATAEKNNAKLRKELALHREHHQENTTAIANLEAEIKQTMADIKSLTDQAVEPKERARASRAAQVEFERRNVEAVKKLELLTSQVAASQAEVARLVRLNQEEKSRQDATQERINQLNSGIKSARQQEHAAARSLRETELELERSQAKLVQTQEKLVQLKMHVANTNTVLDQMRLVHQRNQFKSDAHRKLIVALANEHESLRRSLGLASDKNNTESELVREHARAFEAEKKNGQRLSEKLKVVLDRQADLEEQHEAFKEEMALMAEKIADVDRLLIEADAHIMISHAKLDEQRILKQQQQLACDKLQAERERVQRSVTDASRTMERLQHKFKDVNDKLTKLKGDMDAKEKLLIQKYVKRENLKKSLELVKSNCSKAEMLLNDMEKSSDEKSREIQKLNEQLASMQEQIRVQRRELEQLDTEKSILNRQIANRNEELALVHEKIRVQQSLMNKGEIKFRKLEQDIQAEQEMLRKQSSTLSQCARDKLKADELSIELNRLKDEWRSENAKVIALTEDMQRMVNVHVWRKLESSDPELMSLIEKSINLQKRYSARSKEVDEKKTILSEKDAAIAKITACIARAPGPEIDSQIQESNKFIEERTRQIDSMERELHKLRGQVADLELESIRLQDEKQEVMKKYYMQKQLTEGKVDRYRALPVTERQPQRIIGGGYRVE